MRRPSVVIAVLWLLTSSDVTQAGIEQSLIRFTNKDVTLAGTIFVPTSDGPLPGLVLVHGSGDGERSDLEEVATRLAAGGIAVLAYDKRGSGQSNGNWVTSSLTDLAADAAAAFQYLTGRTEVDPQRSGFWGISRGNK